MIPNDDGLDLRIRSIFQALHAHRPHPRIELNYETPFQLVVAVVLSAQCTDRKVNQVTQFLFAKAPDPEKMSKLTLDELESFVYSTGFYRHKAQFIYQISRILVEHHHSDVPKDLALLRQLPGVGRKSAHVIANELWEMPCIGVDTHVGRVSRRLGLTKAQSPDLVEKDLMKVIPCDWHVLAHRLLVLHGRYVCKAKDPVCHACPIAHLCSFKKT